MQGSVNSRDIVAEDRHNNIFKTKGQAGIYVQADEVVISVRSEQDVVTLAADRDQIDRIFSLALALRDAGLMPLNEDGYWEQPWKWQPEYEAWLSYNSPAVNEEGWTDFVAAASEGIISG